MDTMHHRGSRSHGRLMRVKSHSGAMPVPSHGTPLPRWLASVQLVAAALWHGIKAAW
jgi:hypothetical protein